MPSTATFDQEQRLALKQQVHDAALKRQQAVIDDLKAAIEERQEAVDNPETDDIDYHNRFESTQDEVHDQINHYADQLNIANSEYDTLDKMKTDRLHHKVTIGAVVETDQENFYVSVGLGEFEVAGKAYYALSPKAPVYEVMEGKKEGDTFSFRNRTYKVRVIF